jgi:hypothetical protein
VSALRARAEEYLAMRRALGFKLRTQGRHLMSFVRFCEERGADHVTADLAIEWATQTARGSGDEVYQARRLDVARLSARHLQALDPATEVPPGDVLSRRQGRMQAQPAQHLPWQPVQQRGQQRPVHRGEAQPLLTELTFQYGDLMP